jgi:hypothetical protein
MFFIIKSAGTKPAFPVVVSMIGKVSGANKQRQPLRFPKAAKPIWANFKVKNRLEFSQNSRDF